MEEVVRTSTRYCYQLLELVQVLVQVPVVQNDASDLRELIQDLEMQVFDILLLLGLRQGYDLTFMPCFPYLYRYLGLVPCSSST